MEGWWQYRPRYQAGHGVAAGGLGTGGAGRRAPPGRRTRPGSCVEFANTQARPTVGRAWGDRTPPHAGLDKSIPAQKIKDLASSSTNLRRINATSASILKRIANRIANRPDQRIIAIAFRCGFVANHCKPLQTNGKESIRY